MSDSIGTAFMDPRHVIILHLRAEGENGELGDAQIRVRPGDANYETVLTHVGGDIKPGETRNVAPFPSSS